MYHSSRRRISVLLLLALAFVVPGVSAAGQSPASSRPAATTSLGALGQIWSFLTSVWSDEGCMIDPSGRCASHPAAAPAPTVQGDTGCRIDPSGLCHG